MKTNFLKKTRRNYNSKLVELNKEELKSLQGGAGIIKVVRNPDGSIDIIFIP
ncbi:MAG: hypothetical protein VB110_02830 [Bacteroidales bacterium]|nr:hypothetical protein [Bacteroidales bacterium]